MDATISPRAAADEDCHAVSSSSGAASGRQRTMSGFYPPAFDRDVMRWMPVIVPLLGLLTALLTGTMWMVVG